MRYQDVDQAAGQLVQVERRRRSAGRCRPAARAASGPGRGTARLGRRHLQDQASADQARGSAERIGWTLTTVSSRSAVPGPDRQHRGGLPAGQRRVQQARPGPIGCATGPASRSLRCSAEQGVAGIRRRMSGGIPVMLDDPSGLIDAEDERPRGGVGQKRCDLPHRTRIASLCPWLAYSLPVRCTNRLGYAPLEAPGPPICPQSCREVRGARYCVREDACGMHGLAR